MNRINLTKCLILLSITLYCLPIFADTQATMLVTPPYIPGPLKDSEINAAVLNNIGKNNKTAVMNVAISTTAGVVSLMGMVKTEGDAEKFVAVVASTPGVRNVDTSGLTIANGQPISSDSMITSKVEGALISNKVFPNLASSTVKVKTVNGIVYLTGTATSRAQLFYIITLIRAVDGVRSIISTIYVPPLTVHN